MKNEATLGKGDGRPGAGRARRAAFVVFAAALLAVLSALLLGCPSATAPTSQVDLSPGSVTYSGAGGSINPGSTFTASVPVRNLEAGSTTAAFGVDFHLAESGSFAPSTDPTIGSTTVTSGVPGNSSVTASASVTIPSSGVTLDQNAYVYAVVDAAGAVSETDKTNNRSTTATATVILVSGTSPPSRTYYVKVGTYAASPTRDQTTNVYPTL